MIEVTRTTTPLNETSISWTDYTWNPLHGCSKVSPGCRHCYAERVSRTYGHTEKPWTAEHAAENVQLKPEKLEDPYAHVRYDPLCRVFAPSMSDLFHPEVPDTYIRDVLAVMRNTPTITYQTLTKRPERAAEWPSFPPNLWVGTSVECGLLGEYQDVTHRIDHIREATAAVRWVSFEPLIGRVGEVDLSGIDWIVVGGESHPDETERREMDHDWAVELLEQAEEYRIPYWFKQSSGSSSETGTALRDDRHGLVTEREVREQPASTATVQEARAQSIRHTTENS